MTRKLKPYESKALFQFISKSVSVPYEEFNAFEKFVFVQDFQKGQCFARIGDKTRNVGFVLRGGFSVFYATQDGKYVIRNFCIENMALGSYATILSGHPTHVNIEAFEESSVAAIDYEDFSRFYDRHPSWERLGRKIAEQHYVSRERREYQFLALDAEARYHLFLKEFPGLENRITQASVAAYIGITPVSLSRIIHRSKKKESLKTLSYVNDSLHL